MERTILKLKYQLSSLYIQIINDNGKLYKNIFKIKFPLKLIIIIKL